MDNFNVQNIKLPLKIARNSGDDNGVRFPIDEELTLKKADEVSAFRNRTKFAQFLKSCQGNTNFTKKLIERINKHGDFKLMYLDYLKENQEQTLVSGEFTL